MTCNICSTLPTDLIHHVKTLAFLFITREWIMVRRFQLFLPGDAHNDLNLTGTVVAVHGWMEIKLMTKTHIWIQQNKDSNYSVDLNHVHVWPHAYNDLITNKFQYKCYNLGSVWIRRIYFWIPGPKIPKASKHPLQVTDILPDPRIC